MKLKNKDTYIAVAVFLGLVVVTGIIFSIVQNNRLEADKAELKTNFESCKVEVLADYSADWEGECEAKKLGEDCQLPIINANMLNERLKDNEAECFETYKLEVGLIK